MFDNKRETKKTTTIATRKQKRLINIKLDNFWSYDVTWEL